ncbi:MAG: hypothetical protein ACLQT7_08780 [Candidatus Dormibacteria bacterium]
MAALCVGAVESDAHAAVIDARTAEASSIGRRPPTIRRKGRSQSGIAGRF